MDSEFLQAALEGRIQLKEQMPKLLQEDTKIYVTRCVLHELKNKGVCCAVCYYLSLCLSLSIYLSICLSLSPAHLHLPSLFPKANTIRALPRSVRTKSSFAVITQEH